MHARGQIGGNTCERLGRIVGRVLSGEPRNKGPGVTPPSKGQMTQAIIVCSHQKDGSEVTSSHRTQTWKSKEAGEIRRYKEPSVTTCGASAGLRGEEQARAKDDPSPVLVPAPKFSISSRNITGKIILKMKMFMADVSPEQKWEKMLFLTS